MLEGHHRRAPVLTPARRSANQAPHVADAGRPLELQPCAGRLFRLWHLGLFCARRQTWHSCGMLQQLSGHSAIWSC